jgi:hypothetical protein
MQYRFALQGRQNMNDQSSQTFTSRNLGAVQCKETPLTAVPTLTWQRLKHLSKYKSESNCMDLKWAMTNFKSPYEFKLYMQKLESTLTA